MNYQSFTNLQIKKPFKNSFHSIKIELRDSTGEENPFCVRSNYTSCSLVPYFSLFSLFFEDMQDNVEEVLELLHKLLGELQYP